MLILYVNRPISIMNKENLPKDIFLIEINGRKIKPNFQQINIDIYFKKIKGNLILYEFCSRNVVINKYLKF